MSPSMRMPEAGVTTVRDLVDSPTSDTIGR